MTIVNQALIDPNLVRKTETGIDASLSDLSNIDLTDLEDGNSIIYDESDQTWKPGQGGGGGGEPVGRVTMQNGALDPGHIRIGEGGTYNRATFPDLAAWMDLNGATAFGLTAPQIAAGALPDWRDYAIRTAGGSLGPVVGAKQEDAFQGHRHNFRHFQGNEANSINPTVAAGGGIFYAPDANLIVENSSANYHLRIGAPIADATNGTPRTASETRVKSFGVRWQIKAAGAAVNPGTVDIVALSSQVATIAQQSLRKDQDWVSNLSVSERVTIVKNTLQVWENLVTLNLNNVPFYDLIDLSPFLEIKIDYTYYAHTAGQEGAIFLSSNNGASFFSGAADYPFATAGQAATVYNSSGNNASIALGGSTGDPNRRTKGYILLSDFNVNRNTFTLSQQSWPRDPGTVSTRQIAQVTGSAIFNAMRIGATVGNITGRFIVSVIRG